MSNQDVPARHGPDKKYRMENIPIVHPTPTLNAEGLWILPKDAMPSLNKGAQFCLTNTLNPREDHPRFEDTEENYKQHQTFVQGKNIW